MNRIRRKWLVASGALDACGVLLYVVFSPMRFTAFLLLCIGAAVLLWGFLESLGRGKAAICARRIFSLLLAIGLAVFMILEIKIITYGQTDHEKQVSAVIVLGAGVHGTRPSLSLQSRLEATLAYIEDKPDVPIIVSGGQGAGEDITEARCMADWLIEHGVAQERILLEEKAENTRQNIAYSKEILKAEGIDTTDHIAVVSADYHLYRASLYWGVPWMVPVASHMPGEYVILTANYYIREAFAIGKLLVLG